MTDRPITAHPASPESISTERDDAEPGSFVGNRPERQAATIPGGVRPDDERVAANDSQAPGEPAERESSGRRAPDEGDPGEAGQDH